MPNPILPRRSFTPSAVPVVSTDISAPGELVINWADKVAYTKNAAGTLITVPLGGGGGSGSLSGSVTIPASGDQYWSNTTLLLKGDGGLTDSSSYARALTNNGGVSVSTSTKKFGTGSLQFTGASGSYLSSTSSNWVMNGDFTIEGWAWLDSTAPTPSGLVSSTVASTINAGGLVVARWGCGLYYTTDDVWQQDAVNWTFPTNAWNHFAFVNDGGTLRCYLNGVQQASAAKTITLSSAALSIGALYSDLQQYNWKGFADDLRITAGVCRYPNGTTFTPPTATYVTGPYTASQTLPVTITGSGGGGSGLTWSSVPASATATGTAGSIAYDDAGYFYVCTQENTWSRFASASFWTPNSVSGLQVWLDASSAGTLYDSTSGGSAVAVDGAIARWADKSGNGRHAIQSTSGSRPIRRVSGLNGKPSVQFVADTADSGDWLGIAHASALNGSSGLAIFAVYKTSDSGANRGIAGKWGPAGESWVFGYMDVASGLTTATHIANNGTSSVTRATTSNFNDGASRLLGYVNTSAGLQARMNGVLQGTNTSTVLGNASSTEGVVIGGYTNYGASTGQRLVSCSISELLIYSGSLTSQDVTDIESYLMTKWAIT